MNRNQKIAWFNLIVVFAGFVITVTVTSTPMSGERLVPPNHIWLSCIIFFFIVALAKTLFRKNSIQVDFSEHDNKIHQLAKRVCWIAFATSMVLELIFTCFVVGLKGIVSPLLLLILIVISTAICLIMESVTILVRYAWRGKDGQQ